MSKAKVSHVDLSAIDDRLLDGLDFCNRVYDLFDQIRQQPDGKKRLRLRPSRTDKRLVEELLPLARCIQVRYREGRRINIRWLSGSQQYDAVLWSRGSCVDVGGTPRKVFVEVTQSVHPNDRFRRERLDQRGGSFSVKGLHRDGKDIISKPLVFSGGENAKDLAEQIRERLREKADKPYPPSTVLIINCTTNCLILEDEWKAAVDQVTSDGPIAFREVFLLDMLGSNATTLYGQRHRPDRHNRQRA
jgi:hypothetical protein